MGRQLPASPYFGTEVAGMRVGVTGGSGKGGAVVVRALRAHGHEVLNVDVRPDGHPTEKTLVTDLTDLGQTQDALAGAEAGGHFAALPAPGPPPARQTAPSPG